MEYQEEMRQEIVFCPGDGEECAALDFDLDLCVIATEELLVQREEMAALAVDAVCNRLAAHGAQPVALLATFFLPRTQDIKQIEKMNEQLSQRAEALQVGILGCKLFSNEAISCCMVSLTAYGRAPHAQLVSTTGAQVGDTLIVTRQIGLSGTLLLCEQCYSRAASVVTLERVQEVRNSKERTSIVQEGLLAAKIGVHAMRALGKGGILSAVYEMCEQGECGVHLIEEEIPVSNTTLELCREFSMDPLRLSSEGSLLIATDCPQDVLREMTHAGIPAVAIGKVQRKNMGFTIDCRDGEMRPFGAPRADEIQKLSRIS